MNTNIQEFKPLIKPNQLKAVNSSDNNFDDFGLVSIMYQFYVYLRNLINL